MFGKKGTPDISSNVLFNQVGFLDLKFSPGRKDFIDFKEGHVIYQIEDIADCIYLVLDGNIKIKTKDKDDFVNIQNRNKNELFGEIEYFEELPQRRSSAIAITDVKLCRLSNDALRGLIKANDQILKNLKNPKIEYRSDEEIESSEEPSIPPIENLEDENKYDIEPMETEDFTVGIEKADDVDLELDPRDVLWSDENLGYQHPDTIEKQPSEENIEFIKNDKILDNEFSSNEETQENELPPLEKINENEVEEDLKDNIASDEEILSEEQNEISVPDFEEDQILPKTDADIDKIEMDEHFENQDEKSELMEEEHHVESSSSLEDKKNEEIENEIEQDITSEEEILSKDQNEIEASDKEEEFLQKTGEFLDLESLMNKEPELLKEEDDFNEEPIEVLDTSNEIGKDEQNNIDEDLDSDDIEWHEEETEINNTAQEEKNEPEEIKEHEEIENIEEDAETFATSPSIDEHDFADSNVDKEFADYNNKSWENEEETEKELEPVAVEVSNEDYNFISEGSTDSISKYEMKGHKEMMLDLTQFLHKNIERSNTMIGKYLNFINAKDNPQDTKTAITEITREVRLNQQYLDSVFGFLKEKINVDLQNRSLNDTLNEILPKLAEYSDEHNVHIYKKLDEDIFIDVDEPKFYQACYQVVKNSCEALSGGGKIYVSTKVVENEVEIEFRDGGPGIPEDIKNNVFEPYFSHGKESPGLGLTMAKKIINEHRGKISVTSKIGEGTTVNIMLPRA